MKKILIVHSFYGSESPSGENSVVEEDLIFLRELGYEVFTCFLYSDDVRNKGIIGELRASINYLFGIRGLITLKKACNVFKPDIIHIHNVFPMFSLWILYYASSTATVYYTWHNYRNLCIAGFPIREGKICRKCIDTVQNYGIKHRCYKGSLYGSFVMYLSNVIHKRLQTINRNVDKLICFTNFQKEVLISAGIDQKIIYVKPNFSDVSRTVVPLGQRDNYVLFAGRVSLVKGIHKLLAIWSTDSDLPLLKVCGSGPLLTKLQKCYGNLRNVEFCGLLKKPVLEELMSRAMAVIVPSIAWEGYPMVIADAEKLGTPVFSSGIGPLEDMFVHKEQLINFEDAVEAKESLSLKLRDVNLLHNISELQQIKSKEDIKHREYINLYD
ncbi:glycosyltransferase family 4 protein [Bacteroidia bacterium]|nr:glycosyltransferase family 4 protein [Bacteroidia bacterium]